MIDAYFARLEQYLNEFPAIRSSALTKKIYNAKQGFIKGVLVFEDDSLFEFVEIKNTDIPEKIKYRYQYMDKSHQLIFRFDNAPHHRHLNTFPHHIHLPGEVKEHAEPTLYEVLLKIARYEHCKSE